MSHLPTAIARLIGGRRCPSRDHGRAAVGRIQRLRTAIVAVAIDQLIEFPFALR